MPRINIHHCRYKGQDKDQEDCKDWELEIDATFHKAISHMQRSIATNELYARVINNLHSL